MKSFQLFPSFWRAIIGGSLLLLVSIFMEWPYQLSNVPLHAYWLLILMIVLVNIIGKVLWFEGLKRLSVSKAVSIICSMPVFSLLFAVLFFAEVPTIRQLVGFAITILGLFFLVSQRLSPSEADYV